MKRNARWIRWSSIAAASSVITVSPVLAQDTGLGSYENAVSFGVFGGGSIPLGDFADIASTGWHAGGMLQWNSPTAPLGVRVDGAYHKFGDKTDSGLYASLLNVTINGMWMFPMSGATTARPYLIAGGGVYNQRYTDNDAQTKFGANGGIGVSVPLSGFSTIIEARFHMIFDGVEGSSNSTFVPISVGLHFR